MTPYATAVLAAVLIDRAERANTLHRLDCTGCDCDEPTTERRIIAAHQELLEVYIGMSNDRTYLNDPTAAAYREIVRRLLDPIARAYGVHPQEHQR